MPTFVTYNTAGVGRCPATRRDSRMEFLARNILRARADVVCLQEVGPDLDHFLGHHLQGEFAYLARPAGNDPRGLNVAILSRHPLEKVQSHAQHTFDLLDGSKQGRFSRDLLRVDLRLDGCPWSVYTTHLRSMRGGPSSHRQRESEAEAIVQLLGQQVSDYPWVLTGDLNDGHESATLQRLFAGPLQLCNSLEGAPRTRTLTFPCRKSRHQFDYVLFPASLRARLISSKVWPESRASDHAMVSATFA